MISVIMPVYNAAKFLRESIESILNQSESNFELLIVNDGSTDNSEEIILSYSDRRIVYLKKENGGEASARNMALAHAKGEFIVFQDADDVSLPNRLSVLLSQFTSDNIGFVHSDMALIDERGKPVGYWQSRQIDKNRVLRHLIKIGTPFNNSSMMIRKKLLEKYQYDTGLKVGTDTAMVANFAVSCDSVHVNLPLLLYRRHSNNISKQSDYEVLFSHVRKLFERFSLKELVPELNWEEKKKSEIKAKSIISLFLSRRKMGIDADAWFKDAAKCQAEYGDEDLKNFVYVLAHLAVGDINQAFQLLTSCREQDHIIQNYLGEIYALAGNPEQAKKHFMNALQVNPNYEEPIENLKALGCAAGFNIIDTSWLKFIKI